MKGIPSIILLAAFSASSSLAQQHLSLSDGDISLLELEFAQVQFANDQAGIELPAQIISSPNSMAEISSRFAGVLESWYQLAGSSVEEGEVLATIRSPEVLSLQQQYLAELNNLTLAQQRLDRDQSLLEQGIISEQRYQQTRTQWNSAQISVDTLALQLHQAGLDSKDLADLANGDLEAGLLMVRAPRDGLLTHLAYRVGQYVESNEVVATLNERGNPWVSLQVPGRLENYLEIGSKLQLSGSSHTLTLRQRDFEIDPASQSIEVLAQFDEAASYVPGQLLTIAIQPGQGSLFIPSSAVVHDGSDTLVYVRTPEGVEVRILSLLPVGEGYLAASNLSADEEILVRGAALVKGIQMGLGSEQ